MHGVTWTPPGRTFRPWKGSFHWPLHLPCSFHFIHPIKTDIHQNSRGKACMCVFGGRPHNLTTHQKLGSHTQDRHTISLWCSPDPANHRWSGRGVHHLLVLPFSPMANSGHLAPHLLRPIHQPMCAGTQHLTKTPCMTPRSPRLAWKDHGMT